MCSPGSSQGLSTPTRNEAPSSIPLRPSGRRGRGPSRQRWEGEVGIGERSGDPNLTPALSAPPIDPKGGGEGVAVETASLFGRSDFNTRHPEHSYRGRDDRAADRPIAGPRQDDSAGLSVRGTGQRRGSVRNLVDLGARLQTQSAGGEPGERGVSGNFRESSQRGKSQDLQRLDVLVESGPVGARTCGL
jgi:hypothetical protein